MTPLLSVIDLGVFTAFTPYILLGVGSILSLQIWLVKRSFDHEKKHDLLQQAFLFYTENAGKGAAIVLNKPNPAPAHIRPLIDDYVHGHLSKEGREILLAWAKEVANNKDAPRDERGVAHTLVGALGAYKRISNGTH